MSQIRTETIPGRDGKKIMLVCDCGARARDISKEGPRFLRRHPAICNERKRIAKVIHFYKLRLKGEEWVMLHTPREEGNGQEN